MPLLLSQTVYCPPGLPCSALTAKERSATTGAGPSSTPTPNPYIYV